MRGGDCKTPPGPAQEAEQAHQGAAPDEDGDTVTIQNRHGNTPLKWDNTGVVLEVGDYDKYAVKIDGSMRLTDMNRRYLCQIRTYKELIGKTTPTAGEPAADKAAPP